MQLKVDRFKPQQDSMEQQTDGSLKLIVATMVSPISEGSLGQHLNTVTQEPVRE